MKPGFFRVAALVLTFQLVTSGSVVLATNQPVECPHIEQWDWSAIDVHDVNFPHGFIWGAASSAYQVEGRQSANGTRVENNWTQWPTAPQADDGVRHWDRYKEDIQHMAEIGLKAYRFSIPHEKIEPVKGHFDEDALQHYVDVCKTLKEYGIEPIVTFFHHTWPVWFGEDGAFENEENNEVWLNYTKHVAQRLSQDDVGVRYWFPFNEPVGYCLAAYVTGDYPPGKKKDFALCGKVVRNMMWAHVEFAQWIKTISSDARVGMPHVFRPMDRYHWWNPLEYFIAGMMDYLLNDAVLNFFKTGEFKWGYKGYNWLTDKNEKARESLDIIGVNYYTNTVFENTKPSSLASRQLENNPDKTLYPEGLWRSLKKARELNRTIWIMENGVSTQNPDIWNTYIKHHIKVVHEAKKNKMPIEAYFVWSSTDSFNWMKGFSSTYGLISVDRKQGYARRLRHGIEDFQYLVENGTYNPFFDIARKTENGLGID